MALCGEIVNLVRPGFLNDTDQVRAIGQVTKMQMKIGPLDMRILINILDAPGIERR